MSAIAEASLELTVTSADGITVHHKSKKRWSPAAALVNGKRETVSLTASTFTALSPPTGARAVAILLPTSATSLTLKGVTGDGTGIAISPSSSFVGVDCLISLGGSPSIGIANGSASAVSVDVIWL
jgi:hypothetical protein